MNYYGHVVTECTVTEEEHSPIFGQKTDTVCALRSCLPALSPPVCLSRGKKTYNQGYYTDQPAATDKYSTVCSPRSFSTKKERQNVPCASSFFPFPLQDNSRGISESKHFCCVLEEKEMKDNACGKAERTKENSITDVSAL